MKPDMSYGVEVYAMPGFSLRTGLRDGELTAGGGYQFVALGNAARIDYAFVTESVAPSAIHVFTWSFIF